MTDQVRKAENSETLPKKRFQGTTFENIFFRFSKNVKSSRNSRKTKIRKNNNKKIQFSHWNDYKTRTRDKFGIRALPSFYLTIGSFQFFKHFEGRIAFQAPMKTAKTA